jgi:hypothetical protein
MPWWFSVKIMRKEGGKEKRAKEEKGVRLFSH